MLNHHIHIIWCSQHFQSFSLRFPFLFRVHFFPFLLFRASHRLRFLIRLTFAPLHRHRSASEQSIVQLHRFLRRFRGGKIHERKPFKLFLLPRRPFAVASSHSDLPNISSTSLSVQVRFQPRRDILRFRIERHLTEKQRVHFVLVVVVALFIIIVFISLLLFSFLSSFFTKTVGAVVVLFSLSFRLLLLLQFFFSLVLLLGLFRRELFELVHFLRIATAFLPFSR